MPKGESTPTPGLQEDVKPDERPLKEEPAADDAPTTAEGSRAGSSVAPGDEVAAARKHGLDSSLILNEPRKRAKRESTEGASGPGGVALGGGAGNGAGHSGKGKKPVHFDDPAVVLDKGMQLLDSVRGATEGGTPEGRLIATDFLKLPNRRLYPDYYEIIKVPVALDDVETKIKASEYPSFDAVRADVEHCFVNAKRYNAKGSVIFNDAKVLHKLAKTTYSHLVPPDHPDYKAPPPIAPPRVPTPPPPPPPPPPAAAPVASTSTAAAAEGSSPALKKGQNQHTKRREAEERARQLAAEAEAAKQMAKPEKKAKAPDVWKVLKNRLDKVTQMKEKDTGRVLAFEFMDLIPKSQYPDYYKIIKKPMSFNLIYQKLKRKDYESVDELADDVDLIFSNALVFNMDESQIAIDAVALKQKFHSLVDEMISEGHAAPKGQAKVALPGSAAAAAPADTAGKGKAAATTAAPASTNAADAPASLAKIKIKKKVKPEDASSAQASTPGQIEGGSATPVQPADGDHQPMDVDQPEGAVAPPAPSLDPEMLAALQQLVSSGAFDIGTQQATEGGPSPEQLQQMQQQLQQPVDPSSAPQSAPAAAEEASAAAVSEAAPPVPEKKLSRNEQRALNREVKAAKKAAAAAAKATPFPPPGRLQGQQPSYPGVQGSVPLQPHQQQQQPSMMQPAAPPPKAKAPSVLPEFVLRFPGSDRREMHLRNDRGVKAHALSVNEPEVALEMDVRDLDKGKAREVDGGEIVDDAVSGAANGAAATDAPHVDMAATGDVDSLVNGGGHAQALPPPPGPPKRLYAIAVTSNAAPIDSTPSTMRRGQNDADAFVADPPRAFRLPLEDPKARTGGASWLVEVGVRWRDVDEQSGAVVDHGHEVYELYLRR